MPTREADARLCPLCGRPNACAGANGGDACWCFKVVVPPGLLARVPSAAGGRACICRACIEAFHAELSFAPTPPPPLPSA